MSKEKTSPPPPPATHTYPSRRVTKFGRQAPRGTHLIQGVKSSTCPLHVQKLHGLVKVLFPGPAAWELLSLLCWLSASRPPKSCSAGGSGRRHIFGSEPKWGTSFLRIMLQDWQSSALVTKLSSSGRYFLSAFLW